MKFYNIFGVDNHHSNLYQIKSPAITPNHNSKKSRTMRREYKFCEYSHRPPSTCAGNRRVAHQKVDRKYNLARNAIIFNIFGILFLVSMMPRCVVGNELQGNYAWQYLTPSDRAVNAQLLDLILRRQGGGYNFNTNNTYNTYFAGDQVNCSVSASAVGSSGSLGASGAASSPTILNSPSVSSAATGNSASGQALGGAAQGGSSFVLNASQSSQRSPVNSGVSGTQSSIDVAALQAAGGYLSQALNSAQTNINSPQTAAVSGSLACRNPGSRR